MSEFSLGPDVLYKITINKHFLLSAPEDMDERSIMDIAVDEYNNLDLEDLYITTADIAMVQYYDTQFE